MTHLAPQPFWIPERSDATRPALDRNLEIDIAVVGGGIVGLTTACLLLAKGRRVAVFEARRVGAQATGRSTAKVTSQHGCRYRRLADSIGKTGARRYASANERAIGRIRKLCEALELKCGLEAKTAYVYADTRAQAEDLREEAEAAADLGLPASFVEDPPLPFPVAGALAFADQAQFDPYRYLQGLAAGVQRDGLMFENTRVRGIEHGDRCELTAGEHRVSAEHVVVATQMPVIGEGLYFAKNYPIAHPLAAAPLPDGCKLDGMYLSSGEPTHSFRTAEKDGRRYLVAAGGEFRTGESDEQQHMLDDLLAFLADAFGIDAPSHVWINEDFRPMDGLPFIGPIASGKPNLQVAVGFDAWGITQGTAAAEIIADLILGRVNEDAEVFDASRVRPLAGGRELISENLKAGARLAGDRLLGLKARALDEIEEGQGGIVEHDGEQIAVVKRNGRIECAVSAVCTHMGCVVSWNPTDRTWDCPCHGSRYDVDGRVLSGPATAPLERRPVPVSTPGAEAAR
jgi:glycine/D-amino acid oxidase-like deaminating enzyme/nitrite reductase/ring-hydroxylating ferredoxin subunit